MLKVTDSCFCLLTNTYDMQRNYNCQPKLQAIQKSLILRTFLLVKSKNQRMIQNSMQFMIAYLFVHF